jgi:hypothetical protein
MARWLVERELEDVDPDEFRYVLCPPGSACSFCNGDVPDGCASACLRDKPDEYHYASPSREGAPALPGFQ